MRVKLTEFFLDQNGLTTVEYAVAGALVAAGLVATFNSLGLTVGLVINNIATLIAP